MTEWQQSLFDATDQVALGELPSPGSTDLGAGAWIEHHPRWVSRHDLLFDRLSRSVPWRLERRTMYDRTVDVPRMLCFYPAGAPLPDPALVDAREALVQRYGSDGGGPLRSAGICLYRSGEDSVAWHGDRIGRRRSGDGTALVAIVSLGHPRKFLMRPSGGGPRLQFELGAGDLFVMGGTCQRTWEHAVPKTTKPVGPRISVQFRSSA
jgi:alkylated DNA repair dioxygenase AlkB